MEVANTCQLTFSIEEVADVLPAVMELASDSATKMSSLETPAKIVGMVCSAEDVFAKQEDTWSSFLSKFGVFVSAMDTASEVLSANVSHCSNISICVLATPVCKGCMEYLVSHSKGVFLLLYRTTAANSIPGHYITTSAQ